MRFLCLRCPWRALTAVVGSLCVFTGAEATVTIETSDGRVLTGQVDTRTDADHLWIRRESEQIVLTTAVAWDAVSGATIDGNAVTVDELGNQVPELATIARPSWPDKNIARPSWSDKNIARPSWPDKNMARPSWSDADGARPSAPTTNSNPPRWRGYVGFRRITSVEVDAVLVNRDRDVEPDGLEIVVAAVDLYGNSVPVRGDIYARLWGERMWPNGSHDRFETLQRWNQPVALHDFRDGVARYYLPFRTVRPEFDVALHPDALLNVRLGVPGAGNFEASVPVHIRHFNPIRDRLQLREGSRFFRNELSEEVRH